MPDEDAMATETWNVERALHWLPRVKRWQRHLGSYRDKSTGMIIPVR